MNTNTTKQERRAAEIRSLAHDAYDAVEALYDRIAGDTLAIRSREWDTFVKADKALTALRSAVKEAELL